jgi:hypothetical protein
MKVNLVLFKFASPTPHGIHHRDATTILPSFSKGTTHTMITTALFLYHRSTTNARMQA